MTDSGEGPHPDTDSEEIHLPVFATTHWSVVLAVPKSMSRFITDEWRRAQAHKRGSGKIVSLDAASAESRYSIEPVETFTDRSRGNG